MGNDEALIGRALAGDRAAFEQLAQVYWPVAERAAHRLLRDPELAQDVAQEVFADIYMQRARYQPRFSFQAYVSAMARYKSIDLLRRRKQSLPLDADVPDAQTPEDTFIRRMFQASLYSAVENLPERQRHMLKAYALDGRSYQDIARELGITVAQVKITLYRARVTLRKIREDWEE